MNRERIVIILALVATIGVAAWLALRPAPQPLAQIPPFDAPTPLPAPVGPPVHLSAEQDHARIMKLLNLTALRPGVTPETANADEAKANPYPDLPDPLKLDDGKPVTSPDIWWRQRRQEIADALERQVYGSPMANVPLTWGPPQSAPETVGGVPAVTLHVTGQAATQAGGVPITAAMAMTVTLPAKTKGPVPVILLLSSPQADATPSTWREQVLARGWAAAELDVTSVQADSGAGLTDGIIGIATQGQPRGIRDWGVLRAWAWGASRAVDFFESDSRFDATQIGIAGHSRYGKAALVAMAYEARFAVAYISSSGAGGAAPMRRHFGEQIENLAGVGEYHWFGLELLKYAGKLTPKDLPVDAHDLFALAAPRPVFVSAGSNGDNWVDPKGMFMAEAAASPVYKLLGKIGLASDTMPAVGTADDAGELAFRQHDQGHTMEPNWPYFLKFASRYLHAK
jgi:hypothetical protein